jgi:hypothetical protein
MSTGTATSTGSGNALKVAGVIVLILAGLGFASAKGWISPGGDPSEPGGAPGEEPPAGGSDSGLGSLRAWGGDLAGRRAAPGVP